jgi:hypothetical protein
VKGLTVEEVQQQVLSPGQVVLEYLVIEGDRQRGDAEEIAVFCLPQEGELTVVRSPLPALRGSGLRRLPGAADHAPLQRPWTTAG